MKVQITVKIVAEIIKGKRNFDINIQNDKIYDMLSFIEQDRVIKALEYSARHDCDEPDTYTVHEWADLDLLVTLDDEGCLTSIKTLHGQDVDLNLNYEDKIYDFLTRKGVLAA